jgi:hypothetical protein
MQSDQRQCLYNPLARLANLRPPGRPVGARCLDLHGGVTPRQIATPFDNDVCLAGACRSSSWQTSWRQLLQHDRVDAALEVAAHLQKLPRGPAMVRLIPCRVPWTRQATTRPPHHRLRCPWTVRWHKRSAQRRPLRCAARARPRTCSECECHARFSSASPGHPCTMHLVCSNILTHPPARRVCCRTNFPVL